MEARFTSVTGIFHLTGHNHHMKLPGLSSGLCHRSEQFRRSGRISGMRPDTPTHLMYTATERGWATTI
jgi:hypothetical protein